MRRLKNWLSDGANLAKIIGAVVLIGGGAWGAIVWASTRPGNAEIQKLKEDATLAHTNLRTTIFVERDKAVDAARAKREKLREDVVKKFESVEKKQNKFHDQLIEVLFILREERDR